jgi:circadian clock protein KaiB
MIDESDGAKDPLGDFESQLRKPARFSFVLYIAGATSRSLRAIENAKAICEELLQGRYELEIVDLYQHPEAAKDRQILAIPTLVRTSPAPLRQVVGDLSLRQRLIAGMGLAA